MDNLQKAKARLVLDQPFFASLLLGMPITEDNSVKTMATDGESIKYNAEFMNSLTLPETVFVLAHETMHCVFQHMYRRGNRDINRWNQAGDYIINNMLVKESVGQAPKGALLNSQLVASTNGTTEAVYELIPESEKDKGPGEPGGALDQVDDAGKDDAEKTEKQAEMKVKVIQAANAAKMAGKLSAGISRLVKELVKPNTNWKEILRRFLSERAKVELTYARPKRRFMSEDLYLPSLAGEKMGSVVVAVDCSGSVSPDLLNQFASEIKGIIEDVSPALTHVIYFDSAVLSCESFSPDDSFQVQAQGGGGTAFSPIFNHIDTNDLNPVAVVVLTDLQCSDFGPMPSYPVLWATTDSERAPFGDVIRLK